MINMNSFIEESNASIQVTNDRKYCVNESDSDSDSDDTYDDDAISVVIPTSIWAKARYYCKKAWVAVVGAPPVKRIRRPGKSFLCIPFSNPIRKMSMRIVESQIFEAFILLVILGNCISLAMYKPLETTEAGSRNDKLEIVEMIFLLVFTIEMLLKMIAYGLISEPGAYLRNLWDCIDFVIVAVGLVEVIGRYVGISITNIKSLRAFRVLRPLRLISGLPSLQIVMSSIVLSLPHLFNIFILVLFVVLIYGIIGLEFFSGKLHSSCYNSTSLMPASLPDDAMPCGGMYQCPVGQYCNTTAVGPNHDIVSFDNIGVSMLTVFTCLTLEGWTDTMYWTQFSISSWVWIYYVTLILFGSFFALNLVLGVLSGQFSRQREKSNARMTFVKERHKKMLKDDLKKYIEWISYGEMCDAVRHDVDDISLKIDGDVAEVCTIYSEDLRDGTQVVGTTALNNNAVSVGPLDQSPLWMKRIISSQWYFFFIIAVVLCNTIFLAMDHFRQSEEFQNMLDIANYVFVALFTLEMCFTAIGLGLRTFWKSSFYRFEAFVTVASLVEVIVTLSTGSAPVGISIFRSVRLLRIFKLTRYWRTLNLLINTLLSSIKSIASLLLLLFLFIFVFALLGMQLFGGRFVSSPRSNFDEFWTSMITVFQILTGEDWNAVMYDGIAAYGGIHGPGSLVSIYFIVVMIFGNYILLNIFLAIAVDNLSTIDRFFEESKEDVLNVGSVVAPAVDNLSRKNSFELMRVMSNGPVSTHMKGHDDSLAEGAVVKSSAATIIIEEKFEKTFNANDILSLDRIECGIVDASQSETIDCTGNSAATDSRTSFERFRSVPKDIPPFSSLFVFSRDSIIRHRAHCLARQRFFDIFILGCIIVSSILLALENVNDPKARINEVTKYFDYIFISVFIFEMFLKIIVLGLVCHPGAYLRSGWNVLDAIVVIVSIVSASISGSNSTGVVRVLRVVRVMRPLRTIQRADGLKRVVRSIFLSIMSIGNIMVVSVLIVFLFAAIGVQLFKGSFYSCSDPRLHENREWTNKMTNFDNIGHAILALFEVTTLEGFVNLMFNSIDSVGIDEQPILNNRPYTALYYVSYIVITSFFVINIFIGFVIVTFQREGEKGYEDCPFDKNQRDLLTFALYAKPQIGVSPSNVNVRIGSPRYWVWRFVTHKYFDWTIFVLIILNAVILMMNYDGQSDNYSEVLNTLNIVFTALFTLEAILKLVAFLPARYFSDVWNIFDFLIVVGSLFDVAFGSNFSFNFFRLFRVARLVKLVNKQKGLKQLLWTLYSSLSSLPYVLLLIGMLFYIYAIVGMHLFGRIEVDPGGSLNDHVNFRTFPSSLLLLFRCSTGENWQLIMLDCQRSPSQSCDPEHDFCGTWLAIPYFVTFIILCMFLVLNLFIAVILDNFEYLTRDSSLLSLHQLDYFCIAWSTVDPEATGWIHHSTLELLLCSLEPPIGFGICCPPHRVFVSLMQMAMRMTDEGYINYNTVLLALVRFSHQMEYNDTEMVTVLWNTWPRIEEEVLERALCLKSADPDKFTPTTATWYAARAVQTAYRRFRARKQEEVMRKSIHKMARVAMKRLSENNQDNEVFRVNNVARAAENDEESLSDTNPCSTLSKRKRSLKP